MTILTKKGKKKMAPDRIFSGRASRDMWDEINNAKTIAELRNALYYVCCKLQEFEARLEEGK